MPYRKKGNPTWYVRVPTGTGSVQRSTGSNDKKAAQAIERMLAQFQRGRKREYFSLIYAVHDGRLTLLQLLDADDRNRLDMLQAQVEGASAPASGSSAPVSLLQELELWAKALRFHVAPDTVAHYDFMVRTFVDIDSLSTRQRGRSPRKLQQYLDAVVRPHSPTLADFRKATLSAWFRSVPVSGSTRRKYHAAMTSFVEHLIERDLLPDDNPMRRVKAPRANDPRCRFLETVEAIHLVKSMPTPEHRAFQALLAGTGIEVGVACALRRRDVYIGDREIYARGTKTHSRQRIVRVAEWAWPTVEAWLAPLAPEARLFPGIRTRKDAALAYVPIINVLAQQNPAFAGYQMRDHRHTYAVRAARAGTPPQLIARQLGHANPVMVLKVYGQFMPSGDERDTWERRASAYDERNGVAAGAFPTSHPDVPFRAVEPTRATRIAWPSVPELLDRLKRESTRSLARALGVSDNAIRKHLISRGAHLPSAAPRDAGMLPSSRDAET